VLLLDYFLMQKERVTCEPHDESRDFGDFHSHLCFEPDVFLYAYRNGDGHQHGDIYPNRDVYVDSNGYPNRYLYVYCDAHEHFDTGSDLQRNHHHFWEYPDARWRYGFYLG
jgi:hypothetical protein